MAPNVPTLFSITPIYKQPQYVYNWGSKKGPRSETVILRSAVLNEAKGGSVIDLMSH